MKSIIKKEIDKQFNANMNAAKMRVFPPLFVNNSDLDGIKNKTHISPRWWHKLIFWKKFNYADWYMKREIVSIEWIKGTSQ